MNIPIYVKRKASHIIIFGRQVWIKHWESSVECQMVNCYYTTTSMVMAYKGVSMYFAGPFQGAMFIVDAYSKWPELSLMQSTTVIK